MINSKCPLNALHRMFHSLFIARTAYTYNVVINDKDRMSLPSIRKKKILDNNWRITLDLSFKDIRYHKYRSFFSHWRLFPFFSKLNIILMYNRNGRASPFTSCTRAFRNCLMYLLTPTLGPYFNQRVFFSFTSNSYCYNTLKGGLSEFFMRTIPG